MKFLTNLAVVTLLVTFAASAQAVLVGPSYPPPGGVTSTNTGGVSGTETVATWDYSGFDTNFFSELYFGLDQVTYGPLGVTINGGSLNPMSYVGAVGTTATWSVSAPYTSAGGGGDPPSGSYPVTFSMTVTGLGSDPWIDATTLGLPADIGAVADNSAGADFTLNWSVVADMGAFGTVPLNGPGGVPGPGGHTGFSFASSFYAVAVPEAGAFLCMSLLGCVLATRRNRK